MRQQNVLRQFVVMVLFSLVVVFVLLKADIAGRMAYSIQKGRIEALRESLPSEEELAARFAPDRTVVATVLPAVVRISTERTVRKSDLEGIDPRWYAHMFPKAPEMGSNGPDDGSADSNGAPVDIDSSGLASGDSPSISLPDGQGSGFIVDAAGGYIVTNSHVVERSDTITVHLADGRQFEARLLGADPLSDLAVVQIDAERLHAISWGDSLAAEPGDVVYTVGNPFGLEGTVSRGIISATNRSNVRLPNVEYEGFLQTDAVVNPGNSGGPLVNMRGEVIGVNTAIATRSGNFEGIGFAIPAQRAIRLVPDLIQGLPIARGYLGVQMPGTERQSQSAKAALGWTEPGGVVASEIAPGSPASRSELRANDIILELLGQPVSSNADIIERIGETAPGTVVEMRVWRGGEYLTVEVEVGRQPKGFSTRIRVPLRNE